MTERLDTDLCIIGAGAGGLAAAFAAIDLGRRIVLIERDRMGGADLHRGSVPAKALLAAARRAAAAAEAGRFGVMATSAGTDFPALRRHIAGATAALAPMSAPERLVGLGAEVLIGTATFKDRRTVKVGEQFEVRAKRFVIATGSSPEVPSLPGLLEVPYLTTDTVFALDTCPRHLIVLGAGPTGVELAQAYRRLGAAVTLVDAASPLAGHDPECAAIVLDQLAREGVAVRPGAVARVERGDGAEVRVHLDGPHGAETIEGSHLLMTAVRRANLDGLGLRAAKVRHDADGIAVDARLRTSNRRVYAVGDVVKGAPRLAPIAARQGGLAVRAALKGEKVDAGAALVPRVVFSDPELAEAGLSEAEARARHGAVRVLRQPLSDNARAIAERRTEGHVKLLADRRGTLLGVSIVAPHAGEMIGAWALAISHGATLDAWRGLVAPYPTLAEAGPQAATGGTAPGLTKSLFKRIITVLRRSG